MKKPHDIYGFLHSRAFMKATTCLILAAGGWPCPLYAVQDNSSITSVTETQQSDVTVHGSVKDAKGSPIMGASIVEKGTSNGTVSDMDGNYSIRVKSGSTLTVSYLGFLTREVKAGNNVNITLQEDLKSLNEVVVIGYGTQRKGDVTSAITSIKSEDFTKGNIKDAAELIKGKVAGLNIANGSGDPNSTSSIRLRGVISLYGGSSPLVLIDGVEGGLGTVAPENIENIDVLKDASAAAIYGTRGANGVILITTKNGNRMSNTTTSYSGYLSLSSFANKLDFMSGTDVRN